MLNTNFHFKHIFYILILLHTNTHHMKSWGKNCNECILVFLVVAWEEGKLYLQIKNPYIYQIEHHAPLPHYQQKMSRFYTCVPFKCVNRNIHLTKASFLLFFLLSSFIVKRNIFILKENQIVEMFIQLYWFAKMSFGKVFRTKSDVRCVLLKVLYMYVAYWIFFTTLVDCK